jgi:hypothetical protein
MYCAARAQCTWCGHKGRPDPSWAGLTVGFAPFPLEPSRDFVVKNVIRASQSVNNSALACQSTEAVDKAVRNKAQHITRCLEF